MLSLVLKQKSDGKIRVSSIQVDSDTYHEHPFIKDKIRRELEDTFERLNIKVLKDRGIVNFD